MNQSVRLAWSVEVRLSVMLMLQRRLWANPVVFGLPVWLVWD